MQGIKNLTHGPINRQLFNLAMPIMATSFIQLAYRLTVMAGVGRLGSEAVAAIGSVGILTWMSGSISLLNKVGSEVSVGQSIGAQDQESARHFASHNITIALILSLCWGGLLFILANPIIRIYELEESITAHAIEYLRIISTGLPFVFLSAAFTGIYNGTKYTSRSVIYFRFRIRNQRSSLCHLDFGSDRFLYLYLSTSSPGRSAGRFPLLHPFEEYLYETYPKIGIARSHTQYPLRLCQHVPLPHRLCPRRTYRAHDLHYRWTNRSHHLEHLTRFFYRTQYLYRPELCSRTHRACHKSLAHHPMDDRHLRNVLHPPVCILRQ